MELQNQNYINLKSQFEKIIYGKDKISNDIEEKEG